MENNYVNKSQTSGCKDYKEQCKSQKSQVKNKKHR